MQRTSASHLCLIGFVGTVMLTAPLAAEVQKVALPGDYADFALHPQSGDLAALSAEDGQFLLFRAADLLAGKATPAAKLRVGASPCSVCYKQFGDKHVFAVVCSQDSHMYLVDAKDGTLVRKVELAQSGVSSVACSTNPADPFVYYNYGGGHDSMAGVVSLRDLANKGLAFDDSMDCVISASGQVAYRRGPWSPSGFESLLMTSSFSDDKPVFTRLFYDHNSTAQYVPDPFDRYTAAGNQIYTRSLEKKEAGLDFTPQCFFRKKPVVIGAGNGGEGRHFQREATAPVLQAASYNTFTPIGRQVKLDAVAQRDDGALPRGVGGDADFKVVAKRSRYFADDERDRVVVADRNQLYFVPLAEFELPEEPFLLASLEGNASLRFGQENVLTVKPLGSKVEVVFDDLPEGMQSQGTRLTWKPTTEQIGPFKVAVTLKHADIQRTQTFDLAVEYPHIALPFQPASLAVSPDGKQAILWEGNAMHGGLHGLHTFPGAAGERSKSTYALTLIDLATGKSLGERKLAEPIVSALLTANYVVLAGGQSPRCEVLKVPSLEREKSLVAEGPIASAQVVGKLLVLQTATGVEIYEVGTFRRVKNVKVEGHRMHHLGEGTASVVTGDGIFLQGVLFDADLKPRLVISPELLPTLGGEHLDWQPPFSRRRDEQMLGPGYIPGFERNGVSRVASGRTPDGKVGIALDMRTQQSQVPGAIHTSRQELEVSLTASGATDERQVLIRTIHPAEQGQAALPQLRLTRDEAFVAYKSSLYRWPIPRDGQGAEEMPEALAIKPEQSAFGLSGTGKTSLKHQTVGGVKPLKFAVHTAFDAITIDENTGDVTVDEAAILKEAEQVVEKSMQQQSHGRSLADALRAVSGIMIAQAEPILGRKPKGVPVGVPIFVEATDANLATAKLQYFLVAEVPSAPLFARLKELDDQRQKQMAERAAQPPMTPVRAGGEVPVADSGSEVAALRRRVDALEQRLDLIIRMLNEQPKTPAPK